MKLLGILVLILFPQLLWSQTAATLSTSSLSNAWWLRQKENLGLNYTSFFNGPGILGNDQSITPNAIGKPVDDGLALTNNLSFKYRLKEDLAVDFQARVEWVMDNGNHVDHFQSLRWQSPRLGISTTFFKTQNSKLTGALNSDLPYFFPEPIGGGYIAAARTTIATPGLFAKYTYTPINTRWSIFSLVQPRFYIYENRHVAEKQLSRAGYAPELKNEFTFNISPSVNYAITDRLGTRIGTDIIYKKLVASSWNPTHASMKSADPKSPAWRFQPLPLQMGFTYVFSKALEISTYVQGYPIASQRLDKNGSRATFEQTISAGAWISGILF